jgi:hypothetical protein
MLNKLLFFLVLSFCLNQGFSQVLYSQRFNGLALTTATNSSSQTYLYADVPSGMQTINNGSLIADTLSGNYPFRANGQKQKAWLSYVPAINPSDTFAVSTSWLNPIGTASAWLITPTITVSANTVLSWESMSPDVNNPDGYEVYISTTNSPTAFVGDFSTIIYSKNAEVNTWQTRGVSLSAFSGQTIRIAFKNNSSDKYQLWLDDIKVENISTTFDAKPVSHSIYKYSAINTTNTISALFKNNGATPISNLTINYQMNNGAIISEIKVLSPAVNYLESREIPFSTLYNSTIPVYNTFKIWTGNINGQADQFPVGDTITGELIISSSTPVKKVLVEEFTGATHGWSPESYTTLKSIVSTNTNVIVASIHDGDNMTTSAGDTLITDFAPDFPSALIDRYSFSANTGAAAQPVNWNTYITQRAAMKVPATVTITNVTYNSTTNQIDATVSSTFVGDVKGDYRLNLYIKENNVYGILGDSTDNGWNQYNSLYSIPASPYYQYGNLVGSNYIMSAVSYKHQNVINFIADSAYGAANVIVTSAPTIGQTFSKNYSYIIPTLTAGEFRFNADNMYLIATVSEYNSGINEKIILNAAQIKVTTNAEVLVGIKELQKTDIQLNLYPNPSSDICHLNFNLKENEFVKISVYNMLGELVYIETTNLNAGNIDYVLNLNELHSGNYSVQVSLKNNSITKKLTIIK